MYMKRCAAVSVGSSGRGSHNDSLLPPQVGKLYRIQGNYIYEIFSCIARYQTRKYRHDGRFRDDVSDVAHRYVVELMHLNIDSVVQLKGWTQPSDNCRRKCSDHVMRRDVAVPINKPAGQVKGRIVGPHGLQIRVINQRYNCHILIKDHDGDQQNLKLEMSIVVRGYENDDDFEQRIQFLQDLLAFIALENDACPVSKLFLDNIAYGHLLNDLNMAQNLTLSEEVSNQLASWNIS